MINPRAGGASKPWSVTLLGEGTLNLTSWVDGAQQLWSAIHLREGQLCEETTQPSELCTEEEWNIHPIIIWPYNRDNCNK